MLYEVPQCNLAQAVKLLTYLGHARFKPWPENRLSCGSSWLFSFPSGKSWDRACNYAMTASFHIFSNSVSAYHPTILRLIVRDTNSVLK
jgi:hypothetical protein